MMQFSIDKKNVCTQKDKTTKATKPYLILNFFTLSDSEESQETPSSGVDPKPQPSFE